jgi:hypothetical protein
MDLAGITTKKKKNDSYKVSWLRMYPFLPLNFGEGTQNHDVQLIDASGRISWRPLLCPALDLSPALPRIAGRAALTSFALLLPPSRAAGRSGAV